MASKDTSRDDVGLALAKLWGASPKVRRGPKPKLTLQVIVDTAVSIARDKGLAAVSMAGVAEAVGCAKMALYRHVSDRDDLLAAMLDSAVGEPPTITGDWRHRFSILWDALLELYARDPWLLEMPSDIDTLTPRNAAWIDTSLLLFKASTLPSTERLGTVLLITENARFVARQQVLGGKPANELDRLLSTVVEASVELSRDCYPHLAALSETEHESRPVALPAHHVRDMMMRSIARYFPPEAS